MNKTLTSLSSLLVLFLYAATVVGCGSSPTPAPPAASHDDHGDDDHSEHDDDEGHDHDDHAGHDHPAHGPNGGHMVELSGGAHAEWAHDDDTDLITVYPEDAGTVTKIEMKTTIQGDTTVYPFTKTEQDSMTIYTLTSPELLTAIKMGDAVAAELVITTADGEATGKVAHHAH